MEHLFSCVLGSGEGRPIHSWRPQLYLSRVLVTNVVLLDWFVCVFNSKRGFVGEWVHGICHNVTKIWCLMMLGKIRKFIEWVFFHREGISCGGFFATCVIYCGRSYTFFSDQQHIFLQNIPKIIKVWVQCLQAAHRRLIESTNLWK